MINSSFIKLNRVDDTLVMRLVKKKFRSSFWCVLLFYFLLLIIILTFITHLFINTKLTQINIADIIFKIVFLHFQAIKMNYRVCFQKFEYGSPPSHARKSCGRSVVPYSNAWKHKRWFIYSLQSVQMPFRRFVGKVDLSDNFLIEICASK